MAKTKAKAAPETARHKNVLILRGTAEWKAWLDGFAAHRRATMTGLIDVLLAEAARREKYPPPPRRIVEAR